MKPLIQKIPLQEDKSFAARFYESPLYETPWHQHEEIELVLCIQSLGSVFIGDYIGDYGEGEVYLLGKNLPHWYRKKDKNRAGKAIVVHFKEEMFGNTFLNLPELQSVKALLHKSTRGIRLQGNLEVKIRKQLYKIIQEKGFERLNTLVHCLYQISISQEYELLSGIYHPISSEDQDRIGAIYEYSMQHYREPITLQQMADLTNQSVSNFCKYFKQNTKKTYIQFLNEIRIAYACKLLKESSISITEICYESGFRNWANFSSQFKKVCQMTPSEYRKKYRVN